jgi:glutamine synthetase
MMVFFNPTVNAYRRISAEALVPTRASWGHDHRMTLVRVPTERGSAARLELRVGDGACSPHFLLALTVLAGLRGLRDELEPPPVVTDFEPDGALPGSLAAALDAFAADPLVRAEVPADLRDGYLAMKRLEIELVDGLTDAEACARYARAY